MRATVDAQKNGLVRPSDYSEQLIGLADDLPMDDSAAGAGSTSNADSKAVVAIKQIIDTLKALKVRYFRFGLAWDRIEKTQGHYDWALWDQLVSSARREGITVMPYVCYTPAWAAPGSSEPWKSPPTDLQRFGDFVMAAVEHFGDQVESWELWNEPDNRDYWAGTPAQFTSMIVEAARRVRGAHPEKILVLGGYTRAAGFAKSTLVGGHLGRFVDVAAIHGYHETWEPEPADSYGDKIAAFRELVHESGGPLALWFNEFGYSSTPYEEAAKKPSSLWWHSFQYQHSPQYQAVQLWRDHVLARASNDVGLTVWYRVRDLPRESPVIGDMNNRHLGLITPDGRPKPAYAAMKFYVRELGQPARPVVVQASSAGGDAQVFAFEKRDGHLLIIAWLRSVDPARGRKPASAEDHRDEKIDIRLSSNVYKEMKVFSAEGRELRSKAKLTGAHVEVNHLKGNEIFIAEVGAQ